ncbi:hypothetical protein [Engelhardtia mirabilis]|uniref:Uncharacterized protein n=1 Tax=Engelhardtia mirabilis TaxID=2528011 RepID=A0A518BG88_9BACT|nr:hypothetical protein Pla133_10630 [Planctomycetes bacterium Pla133]QDV00323.1 hypothetical protein Pla86_10620 [Planctomycetes bacterium Pla86]
MSRQGHERGTWWGAAGVAVALLILAVTALLLGRSRMDRQLDAAVATDVADAEVAELPREVSEPGERPVERRRPTSGEVAAEAELEPLRIDIRSRTSLDVPTTVVMTIVDDSHGSSRSMPCRHAPHAPASRFEVPSGATELTSTERAVFWFRRGAEVLASDRLDGPALHGMAPLGGVEVNRVQGGLHVRTFDAVDRARVMDPEVTLTAVDDLVMIDSAGHELARAETSGEKRPEWSRWQVQVHPRVPISAEFEVSAPGYRPRRIRHAAAGGDKPEFLDVTLDALNPHERSVELEAAGLPASVRELNFEIRLGDDERCEATMGAIVLHRSESGTFTGSVRTGGQDYAQLRWQTELLDTAERDDSGFRFRAMATTVAISDLGPWGPLGTPGASAARVTGSTRFFGTWMRAGLADGQWFLLSSLGTRHAAFKIEWPAERPGEPDGVAIVPVAAGSHRVVDSSTGVHVEVRLEDLQACLDLLGPDAKLVVALAPRGLSFHPGWRRTLESEATRIEYELLPGEYRANLLDATALNDKDLPGSTVAFRVPEEPAGPIVVRVPTPTGPAR